MSTPSREVHLIKRPEGMPQAGDFALVETDVADPGEGQVLVRNLLMSVDPAMRPRMTTGQVARPRWCRGYRAPRIATARANRVAGHEPSVWAVANAVQGTRSPA